MKVETNTGYWYGTGTHQADYDRLRELVPESGSADDRWIDLFRVAGNIYYDCYNNGGCNLTASREEQMFQLLSYREWLNVESKHWDKLRRWFITVEWIDIRQLDRRDPPCPFEALEAVIDAVVVLVKSRLK